MTSAEWLRNHVVSVGEIERDEVKIVDERRERWRERWEQLADGRVIRRVYVERVKEDNGG